jgi:hypothetical protein
VPPPVHDDLQKLRDENSYLKGAVRFVIAHVVCVDGSGTRATPTHTHNTQHPPPTHTQHTHNPPP